MKISFNLLFQINKEIPIEKKERIIKYNSIL